MPTDRAERALYVDLRKGTELGEDSGWVVDRLELDDQTENAMRSMCRVDRETQLRLEAWLTGQIALAGGPAEQQFRENGGDLDAVRDALELEHVRAVLRHGMIHAADDCPFWFEPESDFIGVQGDAHRLVLIGESGGFGALVVEGDEVALGGGGFGRLMVGHGIGSALTLAVGAEMGGTGAFVQTDPDSVRSIETTFTAALPVLLRITRFSRLIDFEVAPVLRIADQEESFPPGIRTSVGAGLAAMRTSSWMPYVVIWVGYAYHPPHEDGIADHSARIGTRVGIDLDP